MPTETILFCFNIIWLIIIGILVHYTDIKPRKEFLEPEEDELNHDSWYDLYDTEGGMTDIEADADTFKSIGWGTDEDYGYYGEDESW